MTELAAGNCRTMALGHAGPKAWSAKAERRAFAGVGCSALVYTLSC
jgi:hypothetical protein